MVDRSKKTESLALLEETEGAPRATASSFKHVRHAIKPCMHRRR
jgi:hypothetical protein